MDQTLKIVLGYVIFFFYFGAVTLLAELVAKKTKIDQEICRKVGHIATSLCWLIGYWFLGATVHLIIINAVGCLALALMTFTDIFKFAKRDEDKSYGLFYFGVSTLIVACVAVFVNKDLYILTGISYYCMALGDGFAPLSARLFKKFNFKIVGNKTFFGSLAVFAFSSLSTWIFSLVCNLEYGWLFILSVGALASAVELFSKNCTDNLTVELFVFGYLVLNYHQLITLDVQIALIVAFPMMIVNGASKALTDNANLVAWIYYVLSTAFAGIEMATTIMGLYVLSAFVGVLSLKLFNKTHKDKVKLSRKTKQILANSLVAFICCATYAVTQRQCFLFVAMVVIAEEFADSMASDIGKLSRHTPRDIVGFKKVPNGISGGVTILGSVSAVIASAVALSIPLSFTLFDGKTYFILMLCAVVGVFVDSILGSRLQVLYKCSICNDLTERLMHCNVQCNYHKGIKWMDNSMVNFFSGLFTAIITLAILTII